VASRVLDNHHREMYLKENKALNKASFLKVSQLLCHPLLLIVIVIGSVL